MSTRLRQLFTRFRLRNHGPGRPGSQVSRRSSALLFLLVLLAAPATVRAQKAPDVKAGVINSLYTPYTTGGAGSTASGPPRDPGGTAGTRTNNQYSAVALSAGGSGPISTSSTHSARYPSGGVVVLRSSIGAAFATGLPRYYFGDEILPPLTKADGTPFAGTTPEALLAAAKLYWRPQPVFNGEVITVRDMATNSNKVNPVLAEPALKYSYTKHGERVYAHQPGMVTVRWVARNPEGSNQYPGSLEETFLVSNNTLKTVHQAFWSERTFDGPRVVVPDSRIVTVNPLFNTSVPAQVDSEVVLPGIPAVPNTDPGAIRKTVWFERYGGEGSIHVYNVEGRILLEYLGGIRFGTDIHESLGVEVVDIVRAPVPNYLSVSLGEEIKPHDGNTALTASPKLITTGEPAWYGTTVRPDGTQVYHAERETGPPNVPEDGRPAAIDAYNKVVFYWLEEGAFAIKWPKFQDRYWQRWPVGVQDYAHNTVLSGGSPEATGVAFDSGVIPGLIYQDDSAQTEAFINANSQRFQITFATSPDTMNRSLLKFSANGKVWYVRVYTQASDRAGYQEGNGDGTFNATVDVGSRIPPPPDFTPPGGGEKVHYEPGGYIASGTGYHPGAYLNPLSVGVDRAGAGAIIPVNAMPGNKVTEVWWYRKITPPSSDFQPIYLPAKIGRYTAQYPAAAGKIVIAQGVGTGDLQPYEAAGSLYVQNTRGAVGFNPNEEHALLLGTRAYALRDDLNLTGGSATDYTSEPYLLLSCINPTDKRPDMRIWKVVREDEDHTFNYPAVAGTLLNAPYPLPVMPLPMDADGKSKNIEIPPPLAAQDPAAGAGAPAAWAEFTMKDRKGFHWVYRGPHDGSSADKRIAMQFYYISRADFFVPSVGVMDNKTILPFLRPIVNGEPQGNPVTGTPLTIYYTPEWPENAPVLQVGETLTLPKFGLPQVRGQVSAEVFYEQSRALLTAKNSVTLHDPTREKTVPLDSVGLEKVPDAIATTNYLGRIYFQRLSPELAERIYVDPLRGPKGTLVFKGEFVDEIAGEDYLNLNVLTLAQKDALKALVPNAGSDQTNWANAIEKLSTQVETFKENPLKKGTYIVGSSVPVSGSQPAKITSADTAVDSYALTATGEGEGWVTMVMGNGAAFTPVGDPVQLKVFKVVHQLYTGDLKVLLSKNPLDEQVTLRHSADYAGKPEDYEFDWRYAPGLATAPDTYEVVWQQRLGAGADKAWDIVRNPAAALPTPAEYAAAGADTARNDIPLPRTLAIRDSNYTTGSGLPGVVLKSTAAAALDFTVTGVPGDFVFSADLDDVHGFVLYVNGIPALANQAPAGFANTNATSGLVTGGLSRQFRIARSYFLKGANRLEIALHTTADVNAASRVDFRLDVAVETEVVDDNYQAPSDPQHKNTNTALVGGDSSLPFGGPAFTLNDRWFTMRYRPKNASNVAGTVWSRWMPPQFVEGWIKRVLREINPFQQRVKDLFNNEVNTDTSVLTQAGTRWEGDVALTLSNINDVGLISIYETVLNRARSMSIDANTDDPDSNNALQLAAGYLSDLYALLGNEAFADAANPTISTDDDGASTEISTSRFSFENQEPSTLEEELALLRGRDASSTSVAVGPVYNRLYWNYTGGINAGEVIYATNYNIKEKTGSPNADGVIDAADAARMFPQGHGDAYGHYLTALSGYYRLLANDKFSWQTRAEAITVLGQAVTVDYADERKLAGDAALLARTAERVCHLTWRQQYEDNPAAGWEHFRDTENGRSWGLDEWASRSAQGAYYHWVTANSLLPATDDFHTGVQKIDRGTVPELNGLAAGLNTFQTIADNAGSRLNPLGLSPGSMAFDLDPNFQTIGSANQGKSHFRQIQERAQRSLVNAAGSFHQAARMTRLLRTQENQVDDYNTAIVAQERAYRNELIEIFGRPYAGSVGPGRTYAQDYYGPDTAEWFIVDRPSDLDDTVSGSQVSLRILKETAIDDFTNSTIQDIINEHDLQTTQVTVKVSPNQFIQYSDLWTAGGMGTRPETGELQAALLDCHRALLDYQDAMSGMTDLERRFKREGALILEMIASHAEHLDNMEASAEATITALKVQKSMEYLALVADNVAEVAAAIADGSQEMLPKVLGLAADGTAPARGGIKLGGAAVFAIAKALGTASSAVAMSMEIKAAKEPLDLLYDLDELDFKLEEKQQVYEFEKLHRQLTGYSLAQPALAYQQANERVRNVLARGLRVMEEREDFRKRAAAIIQGYRTRDVSFRIFRNEALEQYRSLFDLASRYSYLAAKSYDYETGLLGTPQGQELISGIVAARSLGDLSGSALGDSGLAGGMAKLVADFSVAESRLGINNPDIYSTLFSLRGELFRIPDRGDVTSDDDAWRQVLEQHFKSDLLTDADVATWCRNIKRPNGAPVPGIVIPFSTTIQHGLNFFGLPLAAGDHAYSPTNFATKISRVGIALPGYVGMDEYQSENPNAGLPALSDPLALSATPYVYLIPTGEDYLLAPPLGDINEVRSWRIEDQALPLPFNLGASAFNNTQFFNAAGTLSSQPWVLRKHQAFRPVSDPLMFQGEVPADFTNSRLIARSVWNSGWKIVIPAYTLLNNEQEGLNRFAATVRDIRLFIKSYSHSGN
ncbi:MAG: hypothetical protein V4726_04355 [Verrucomicrobiota bacterium]